MTNINRYYVGESLSEIYTVISEVTHPNQTSSTVTFLT